MDKVDIRLMKLEQIAEFVLSKSQDGTIHTIELEYDEREAVTDRLGDLAAYIGKIWDAAEGTDPRAGKSGYGTPNRRSMTYKLRKAAGFSYP